MIAMFENMPAGRCDFAFQLSACAVGHHAVQALLQSGFFGQLVVDEQSGFEKQAVFRRQLPQKVMIDAGRVIHKNRNR